MGLTLIHKSRGPAPKTPRRVALVLAGGAISGGAFKVGGIKALEDYLVGRGLCDLDIYVGLSAGAVLAVPLAGGISPSEMIRVQAVREHAPGIAFPKDTQWMREFEASFPWDETEDQINAIAAMKSDMESPRPMDRLICGDVGFGKTEIAIRGAFKAVESGRQVAILVPTTVLAVQHERTFRKRLADFPFVVESLTRFHTAAEQKEILERNANGEVDILIGTHRILSKDVHFNRLGLVVIDEEQRFGVEHKQKLLAFRAEADVLTLTATPIPRTLHMALLGIRDISSLQTAPVDRRAVVTEIKSWDKELVRNGIRRELAREGQVFYVHNRVYDIDSVAEELQKLVPEARVLVGHGQMPPKALEKVMLEFVRGDADILVSYTAGSCSSLDPTILFFVDALILVS